jgi:hypothetical protein
MTSNRLVHAALAGLIAAASITTFSLIQSVSALPATSPTAFVPIVPCRLADTRPAPDNVGARDTPIAGGESVTFAVRGTNGNCTIPETATAVMSNVTLVGASAAGFLTVYPADAPRPVTSNLNSTAGGAPTPNQVTVGLSSTGAIAAFNNAGSVDVIIDLVGYFAPGAAGPAGPAGASGASAWDTIPSGQTVTGGYVFDSSTTGATGADSISISLPGVAPAALTDATVNFASGGADNDATCTGSAAAPTAPAGKVCIYPVVDTNVQDLEGFRASTLADQGFVIVFVPATATIAQDMFFDVTWAYTAP